MSQYNTGTVAVTNGAATVTGTGTLFAANVTAGDFFTVVGDNAFYTVGSVDSDTQLTLAANYAGVSGTGKAYTLVKDFTTNLGFPVPNQGDIETALVVKRAIEEIDSELNTAGVGGDGREWIDLKDKPTFVSATQFTVVTDKTANYHSNRRIRATDSATLYGAITASSFAASVTTVTVVWDTGSLTAGLTTVALGIGTANSQFPISGSAVKGGTPEVDTISEATAAAGVTVDGVLHKDGLVDTRDVATDGAKLDGIEALADVTDATNVEAGGAVMEADFNASTILAADTDNTPVAVTVAAGTIVGRRATGGIVALTDTETRTILNVENGATADQTNGEIKTAYEANADTNAFDDAEQSKLAAIEASADVTDAVNVNAAGAIVHSDIAAATGFLRKTAAETYVGIDGVYAKNTITNGDGRIQQRGNYTLIKDAYDFAGDRFEGMATGTAVSAGVLKTVTNAPAGSSGHAHEFNGVTLTGTGVLFHRHRIESLDAVAFKNQSASVSVVVHHNIGAAKTFTLFVRKADVKDDFSAVTEVSNDGGTSVADATTTMLKFENVSMGDVTNGIELELKMEVGAITTKVVSITEWQLELGAVSTPFEQRPMAQELELVKRYYEELGQDGVVPKNYIVVQVEATTVARGFIGYREKRAIPAITISAAGDFGLTKANGARVACSALSFAAITRDSARTDATIPTTDLVQGNASRLEADKSANRIKIDAEL